MLVANMSSLTRNKFLEKLYGLISVAIIVALMGGSLVVAYTFLPMTTLSMNALFPLAKQQNVYVLVLDENIEHLDKTGFNPNVHSMRMEQLTQRLQKIGHDTKLISGDDLFTISPQSTVILADSFAMSVQNKNRVLSFLERGGNLVFNYHAGFFDDKNNFLGADFVEKITGLKKTRSIKDVDGLFFVPRIFSPLLTSKEKAERQSLILYDPLPLFYSEDIVPDAFLTNWSVASTPFVDNEHIPVEEAGIIWHGNYGKGSWVYFSFPTYVFLEKIIEDFSFMMNGILNFLKKPITVVKFPYIDSKKAVFISMDAEFKFEEVIHFARLTKEYDINTTIFTVASLAKKHPELVKEFATFPNVELASHSYSHTRIMGESEEKVIKEIVYTKEVFYDMTGIKIVGIRPPREELDDLMSKWLIKSGYTYVLEKEQSFLIPREVMDGLITIPRRGTDDFTFMINLRWDKENILERMIYEVNFISSLNALYTLSIHTHLLAYKSNLDVVEGLFKYLQTRDDILTLTGKEVTRRHNILQNIEVTSDSSQRNQFIFIRNLNDKEVKDFTFRVHWHNLAELGTLRDDLFGVDTKEIYRNEQERYSDIRIKRLRPRGSVTLTIPFLKHAEGSS